MNSLNSCVALLSGGLDSSVSAALAARKMPVARCLFFDYGQKAAKRELSSAKAVSRHINSTLEVVRLPFLAGYSSSALTRKDVPIPSMQVSDLASQKAFASAKAVWVPNRNGLFVAIGAARAESLGCKIVVAGFNKEEGRTFPDNSPEFVRRSNLALAKSTLNGVRLVSHTMGLDKPGIVRAAVKAGLPLVLVWSCYEGGRKQCMRCESCVRLRNALQKTGLWSKYSGRLR